MRKPTQHSEPELMLVPHRGRIPPLDGDMLRRMGIPLERFTNAPHDITSKAMSESMRKFLDRKQTPKEKAALRGWLFDSKLTGE